MRAAHKQLYNCPVESIIAPSKLPNKRVVQLNQGTADLVALCTSQVQYGGLGPD